MIRAAIVVLSDVRRCQARRIRSEVKYLLANGAITAAGMGTVLGYGGHLVRVGAMSLGDLVVCYSYLARLADPITAIADAHTKFQKSIASIRRLREFLALVPSVASPARPLLIAPPTHGIRIECDDISFAYGDRRALSGLTCTVQQGEHVGLTGRSGAGKSTAAKLMARLYDPESGRVAINGTDVKAMSLPDLRRLIHYMPQHAMLYTGTVEDNLRYGDPDASAADLRRAIELAQLEPVIGRMPRGLKERVGSDGNQLSGGERQRLAFARALLQRPRVLILDEATAFLDAEVERAIFDNLRRHLPDITLILISHRLSALTWVDRHLLLEDGRLMASGTHAVLHRESGVYRELYLPEANAGPVASLSTSA
jgi:ABC-type multidrug transport system fused ATPase/permease subunit